MCKVFLDDVRDAVNCTSYMHQRIGKDNPIYFEEWIVVRNYDDFIKAIKEHINEITHISIDHDLGEDIAREDYLSGLFSKRKARAKKKDVKTGYDCAKWMKEFYEKHEKDLPVIWVHSQNPIGVERIKNLFK